MSRQELKKAWLTQEVDPNRPTRKTILVETNCGHVTIESDGPDGYSHFKTNQGDDAIQYGLDRKLGEHNGGGTDYSEYDLIIR
jgi:hypothetical protein